MLTADAGKERLSATTSVNGRNNQPFRGEAEFLSAESSVARAAIADTLAGLKGSLLEATDLRAWARVHPWGATGAAAAVGFALASAVVPPAAASGGTAATTAMAAPPPPEPAKATAAPSLRQSLVTMLFELAATAAQQWIHGAMQPPAAATAPGASGLNEQPPAPAADPYAAVEP